MAQVKRYSPEVRDRAIRMVADHSKGVPFFSGRRFSSNKALRYRQDTELCVPFGEELHCSNHPNRIHSRHQFSPQSFFLRPVDACWTDAERAGSAHSREPLDRRNRHLMHYGPSPPTSEPRIAAALDPNAVPSISASTPPTSSSPFRVGWTS